MPIISFDLEAPRSKAVDPGLAQKCFKTNLLYKAVLQDARCDPDVTAGVSLLWEQDPGAGAELI